MMRSDVLNTCIYPVITELTATKQIPTSHVFPTDESKLKEFLVDKTLSHICSTDRRQLKEFPVDDTLSQIYSTDEEKSKGIIVNKCSTEEDKSECVHKI